MPFLGQDWRSPGWSWIKTEDGWKRCDSCSQELRGENSQCTIDHSIILNSGEEEIFNNECEYAAKKRKKEHFGNDTAAHSFYREKWIYVHKESTKELLQLIAKSQLTSLSGVAQKNYFNILDKIVQKVLDDHQNPRLIKDLLQDLSSTLCILVRGVGKSVLVGNINIWVCRLETVLSWQQQLQNLQMTKQVNTGLTLSDLPLHMLNNILYRFSDGWDIVTLGQVTPTLYMLSEDRRLWKKLCQYHFAEKQFCRHLILSEKGHIEWKLMYFTLQKYYPTKEQYGDTLHFCRHCSILFWKDYHLAWLLKDSGHPCTAADPDSCFTPVSPEHFIDLFKF
ncbi:F-box only protein 25 isoform X5 [Meriones unguiculatus]|uniref:F-box only protein 25 isoform X5 n=1 Tax=Meriones unguiculatus TaxID=10047 RepID=UPI00293EB0AA|nr:F-box only protein 25 isoform X5 [Meriones unguiculatus]